MPYVPPISKGEFLQYLQRCIPPGGWRGKIVVANSGGPDSVCLLNLLASLLESRDASGLPSGIVSAHVDHNIQAASTLMAEKATANAQQLGIQHLTLKIPWSDPPFPPNPSKNASFEGICRDARRNRLAHAMAMTGASTIAFAHHADDQVETSIMRMSSGSSQLGASGMRPIRTWGMGARQDNQLTWMGEKGMSKFVVRPLLEVSKDRILATCKANGWEYVTDPTNDQPDLTPRNYVRAMLKDTIPHHDESSAIIPLDNAILSLRALSPYLTGASQLRDALRVIGERVQTVDTKVTNILEQYILPSPPTTLLLPSDAFRNVQDPYTRVALIRRILRYVSPQPWGHISAEANGVHRSLDMISNTLHTSHSEPSPASFTMGAKVWWRPVYLRSSKNKGKGKNKNKGELGTVGFGLGSTAGSNDRLTWLAQREKSWTKKLARPGAVDTLTEDVTEKLRDALERKEPCEVLYDCRVVVEFDMGACPTALGNALADGSVTVHIVPATPYLLPQVIGRRADQPDKVLASFPWPDKQLQRMWETKYLVISSSWIRMSTARTWDPW